jgi:hypothetical protein
MLNDFRSIKGNYYLRYNISFQNLGTIISLMKLINNYTPGVYVDTGCWQLIKSLIRIIFSPKKWKGICIDPNPELKRALRKNSRPSDDFVNVGIGNSTSSMFYYMLEESSMNTFSYEFIQK